MVTNDQARKLALALPEAHEEPHWEAASFRVRKKIFAVLHAKERRVVLKLPLELQAAVVATEPDVYTLTGWSHQGWTNVNLKRVPKRMFEDHLRSAWRSVAPKRVVKAFDAEDG